MKLPKLASASIVLLLTTSANGAVISYAGYTHDTDTNIVTGNELDWLQWDVTLGESINSIQRQRGTLEGGGWRVASREEMAQLYNAFDFGITFNSNENTSHIHNTPYTDDGDQQINANLSFIAMFGDTYQAAGNSYCWESHCLQRASAYFGQDLDNDNLIGLTSVFDDYQNIDSGAPILGQVLLGSDVLSPNTSRLYSGVALVRDVNFVPVPAAVWLFSSGLIGLLGVARRKVND